MTLIPSSNSRSWLDGLKVALGLVSAAILIMAGLNPYLKDFSWRQSLIDAFRLTPATTNPYFLQSNDFTYHRIAFNILTKPGLLSLIIATLLIISLVFLVLLWLVIRFSHTPKALSGTGSVPVKGLAGVVYQRTLKPVGDRAYDLYQAVVRL